MLTHWGYVFLVLTHRYVVTYTAWQGQRSSIHQNKQHRQRHFVKLWTHKTHLKLGARYGVYIMCIHLNKLQEIVLNNSTVLYCHRRSKGHYAECCFFLTFAQKGFIIRLNFTQRFQWNQWNWLPSLSRCFRINVFIFSKLTEKCFCTCTSQNIISFYINYCTYLSTKTNVFSRQTGTNKMFYTWLLSQHIQGRHMSVREFQITDDSTVCSTICYVSIKKTSKPCVTGI